VLEEARGERQDCRFAFSARWPISLMSVSVWALERAA
jgi:hypothetical protein